MRATNLDLPAGSTPRKAGSRFDTRAPSSILCKGNEICRCSSSHAVNAGGTSSYSCAYQDRNHAVRSAARQESNGNFPGSSGGLPEAMEVRVPPVRDAGPHHVPRARSAGRRPLPGMRGPPSAGFVRSSRHLKSHPAFAWPLKTRCLPAVPPRGRLTRRPARTRIAAETKLSDRRRKPVAD